MAEMFYKKFIENISGDNKLHTILKKKIVDEELFDQRDERVHSLVNKILAAPTKKSKTSITTFDDKRSKVVNNNVPTDSPIWSDRRAETIVVNKPDGNTVTIKISAPIVTETGGTIKYEKFFNNEKYPVYSVEKNIYSVEDKESGIQAGAIELVCTDRKAENACYDPKSKTTTYKTNVVMVNPDGKLIETIESTKVKGMASGITPPAAKPEPKTKDSTKEPSAEPKLDDPLALAEGETLVMPKADSKDKAFVKSKRKKDYGKYGKQTRFGRWMMRPNDVSKFTDDMIKYHTAQGVSTEQLSELTVPTWKKVLAVSGIVLGTVSGIALILGAVGFVQVDGQSVYGPEFNALVNSAQTNISDGNAPIIEEVQTPANQEYVTTVDENGNPIHSEEDPNVYNSQDKGADEDSSESQGQ